MACPNCKNRTLDIFYQVEKVPVNSVLLLTSREEALNFPTGNIKLARCETCGFVTNIDFKQELLEYSTRYEGTQAFSPTFNSFNRNLAQHLIERYNLHGKTILEIGCGQGEFLELLCELGENEGIGFDPAFTEERSHLNSKRVSIIKDFYSEKYTDIKADFICCKMTLEHIQDTGRFVQMVRNTVGNSPGTLIFFQVPNAQRIWQELAFWDIYYEHCSYFSKPSLAYLFRKCGFEVDSCWTDYDNQYLMITGMPANSHSGDWDETEQGLASLAQIVGYFAHHVMQKINQWKNQIFQLSTEKMRIVIWGAGSKAVSFLTTLQITKEIQYAVDINPHKHGTFLAGTGQEVVAPEFLKGYHPDFVVIMNPIYIKEIGDILNRMGVQTEFLPVR